MWISGITPIFFFGTLRSERVQIKTELTLTLITTEIFVYREKAEVNLQAEEKSIDDLALFRTEAYTKTY